MAVSTLREEGSKKLGNQRCAERSSDVFAVELFIELLSGVGGRQFQLERSGGISKAQGGSEAWDWNE